jgi:hypothetical protein
MTEAPSLTRLNITTQFGTSRRSRSITQPAAPLDGVTMTAPIAHQELVGLGRGRKAGLA